MGLAFEIVAKMGAHNSSVFLNLTMAHARRGLIIVATFEMWASLQPRLSRPRFDSFGCALNRIIHYDIWTIHILLELLYPQMCLVVLYPDNKVTTISCKRSSIM